ncbi:MAG: tRNA N6-adenosine threonylcarbamoyltransferase [Parcubacteria group bacterium LiPW_15]|nr:MAG: tRNA N6-adenosine threonylcarbamoyltransferase [Parcubacteria group bacterium LiPW_15]
MRILAIETSCDETSLSILEAKGGFSAPKFKVLKHLITSQIKLHEPFGGVVPNIAKREHIKNLPILYREMFGEGTKEKAEWKKISLMAITVGPGLEPALWAGIEFAKKLSKDWKKPLIGANHMEGHLWSFLLDPKKKYDAKKVFPSVALLVSGGHTILLLMKDIKTWKKLGETRDDAVGEAFDKVARILKLPYPSGPQIEKLSREGNENAIEFPRPMLHDKNYDFSYSGLKTSVLYYCRDNPSANPADVAASFQNAATEVLIKKAMRAAKEFKAKSIIMAGGVAASMYLREKLGSEVKKEKMIFLVPGFTFNTDNAAMIGAAGYFNYLRKKKRPLIARGDLGV